MHLLHFLYFWTLLSRRLSRKRLYSPLEDVARVVQSNLKHFESYSVVFGRVHTP